MRLQILMLPIHAMIIFLMYYVQRRFIEQEIRKIGIKNKYYPKGFSKPSDFIAEKFNIRVEIPTFLYFGLIVICSYPCLFFIGTIVFFVSKLNLLIGFILLCIYSLFPGLVMLFLYVFSYIYERK